MKVIDGFSSPEMVRAMFDATYQSAGPVRKHRRKPSRVAPVFHVAGYVAMVAMVAAALAAFIR